MKKKALWLLVALALLPAGPALAYDDEDYEPPNDEDQIKVYTGYRDSSTDESAHRVIEYDTVESNPWGALLFRTSPYDETQLSFKAYRLDSSDFGGEMSLDLKRALRVNGHMDGLLHRLDHDPIANLQAVSDVKVVRSTDFEPGAEYAIKHRLYQVHAEFHPPTAEQFSFRGGVRQQEREGRRQLLTTSHCTSCHTVSQGREVDQSTTDGTVGLHFRGNRWDVDYEVLGRTFVENAPTPVGFYEKAFHPGLPGPLGPDSGLQTPFNDRLWFQNGRYPADRVPEVKRTAHTLKFGTEVGRKDALRFTVIESTTENRTTNLEYQFEGIRGRYTWRPKDNLRVGFYGHHDKLENDPLFVDLLALNSLSAVPVTGYPLDTDGDPATPPVTVPGLSFQDWRERSELPFGEPQAFNAFLRGSALDRTESRLGADLFWRPAGVRGTARFGYEYRALDRDNVVLADGTGETTHHTLKLGWNQRLAKRLRWNNKLVYRSVDNPYVNVDGALRAFREDPNNPGLPIDLGAGSPKSPRSLQYYQLHDLRIADVSQYPTADLRYRTNVTWSPKGTWSLSGNFRYRDAENDDLDYSTWEQSSLGIGANLWMAASPEVHFTLGADHTLQETDAFTTIPLMDG